MMFVHKKKTKIDIKLSFKYETEQAKYYNGADPYPDSFLLVDLTNP